MTITAAMIKQLREATGAGPLACKHALEASSGNIDKAIEFLRLKGRQDGIKKLNSDRVLSEGVIETYVLPDNSFGVMVEVNCETDFVANTPEFREFAQNIAVHIAHHFPQYITRESLPEQIMSGFRAGSIAAAKRVGAVDFAADSHTEILVRDMVLLEQPFDKDHSKTVAQYLAETAAQLGESIEIRRFVWFGVNDPYPMEHN